MSIVSPATGLSAKYRKHVFYREKLNVTMYNIQLYNAQNRNRHGKKKRLVLNTKGKGHLHMHNNSWLRFTDIQFNLTYFIDTS